MVRFIKLYCCFLSTFLLFSCGEDFFDSITEIEIPEHASRLVVQANFDATFAKNSKNFVLLNHTLGILDTMAFQEVDDATVTLYEEGALKANFEKPNPSAWFRANNIELLAGKNYTLNVDSPTYGRIEATQQLPTKVPIITATYEADAAVDRYGERGNEITIQFQDPEKEENYYLLSVYATYLCTEPDTTSRISLIYASPVDPLLEHLDDLHLTDASFDGEMYATRISINEEDFYNTESKSLPLEKITIRLTSLSKDRYLFNKTISAYQDNEGNPFAEPIVVHENIEGGSGIFTLSISDEFSIDL